MVCYFRTVTTFQRARSAEQRSERRRLILDTAEAMLDTMPVAAITLNELSRRVGLAKSNVLRYFESREAVLLELLDEQAREFLADLAAALLIEVDGEARPQVRAREVAVAITGAFRAHPMLCELLAAQSSVLEHNVSVEVASRFKRASLDRVGELATFLDRSLPELGSDRAAEGAWLTIIAAGELWTYSRPADAVIAAIEADPALAPARIPFAATLERSITVLLFGLLSETVELP